METQDRVQEWQRLTELYRQMADVQLESLAAEAYSLTEIAQQVLAAEIGNHKLDVTLVKEPPTPEPEIEEEPPVATSDDIDDPDLRLVWVCDADCLETASEIKKLLKDYYIKAVIKKDDEQESTAGTNEQGYYVSVHAADRQRASYVLEKVLPHPAGHKEEPDVEEAFQDCPECHSEEVIFLSRDPKDESKFRWRCDSCGHKWTDDGVVD